MKRILIVDDSNLVRAVYKETFLNYTQNLDVYCVANAEEALNALHNNSFDLVIIDMFLAYGSAKKILEGHTDPNKQKTGLHLAKHILTTQKIQIFLTGLCINLIPNIRQNPNIKGYNKPFDMLKMLINICEVLQIEHNIPEILKQ